MDFTFTPEQVDATELASRILGDVCTPEALKAIDGQDDRFDPALWSTLGEAGLIGLPLPEELDGSGLGLAELCGVLVEVGRHLAPVPLATHAVTALAVVHAGGFDDEVRQAAQGSLVLTTALAEELSTVPATPAVTAQEKDEQWVLNGTKVAVPAGTIADLFVVPAQGPDGPVLLVVRRDDAGVTLLPQQLSTGERAARLELDDVTLPPDRLLGGTDGGAELTRWLAQRLTVALCAQQLGTLEGALRLTADYAKTREQFGRAIGTFQAVSQRLADGYIDTLGARLTLWQAVWRLEEGLDAETEAAVAKLWAADAGHRIAHTTVHVHGGVGIDLDGEAHRFFTAAKVNEFAFGGATDQARLIGKSIAGSQ